MITVFTPTYNRVDCLKKLYTSLMMQTDLRFEWMVVDDGSTDSTEEFIKQIMEVSPFHIRYLYQKNGGKHRAHNLGVLNCHNSYFLIVDSDDSLTPNAIEVLYACIEKIDSMNNVSGVIGNRIDGNSDKVIGTKIKSDLYFSSGIRLYQKYGLIGDTIRMYKTEVLKKYLFPEIEGEKFLSENVVFDLIDQDYTMFVLHDLIYIGLYQSDGYSANIYKIHNDNPIGYLLSLQSATHTAVTLKKKISYMILMKIWCKKKSLKATPKGMVDLLVYIGVSPIVNICLLLKKPKFFFEHFKGKL